MKRELLAATALTLGSLGACLYGTHEQRDCLSEIADQYGVESVDDFSSQIVEDSNCDNSINTLGVVGVGIGAVAMIATGVKRFKPPRLNIEEIRSAHPEEIVSQFDAIVRHQNFDSVENPKLFRCAEESKLRYRSRNLLLLVGNGFRGFRQAR